MSNLRILVAEDHVEWQDALRDIIQRYFSKVDVERALTFEDALLLIKKNRYDLMIIDLSLNDPSVHPQSPVQQGMVLLSEVRASRYNKNCAIVVLSSHGDISLTNQALREHGVYSLMEKSNFHFSDFVKTARDALWKAYFNSAEERMRERLRLSITFDQDRLISSELRGPNRFAFYSSATASSFKVADLSRRTDNLNITILSEEGDPEIWRPEARSIGEEIYKLLSQDQRIQGDLTTAQRLTQHANDLWLQFSGPAIGLGAPFELMHNGDDYLSRAHVLTRQLIRTGPQLSHKTAPFHLFLDELRKNKDILRILIIGANTDGNVPAAETEATLLKMLIKTALEQVGILSEVTPLLGIDASYTKVSEALHDGHFHIFHYAGHSLYRNPLPETSGIILRDGNELRVLTAAELNALVRNTDLQLVFLSSCLSACSASRVGRGDFHGMFEALVNADVPIVLGYRWAVEDTSAKRLAQVFYETLWQTLSPGVALLEARIRATLGPRGRDDETWAAPVLVMQNG